MAERKKIFLLVFLLLILLAVNYNFLDGVVANLLDEHKTEVHVERIVDGDTIKAGNLTIRLLGINTPERGEQYHDEAENFLASLIENKTVKLEFGKDRTDRYGRTLAYLFLDVVNINQKQIDNGFANYYFPSGKDSHYNDFTNAWNECLQNNKNLCEKSNDKCSSCIELKSFKGQTIILKNKCSFSCDLTGWDIKDEGRKHFSFPNYILNSNDEVNVIVGNKSNYDNNLFWNQKDYVWTKTGDTLFLRDKEGKLVLWDSY